MRWNVKPSKDKTKWHKWYAWYPVRVDTKWVCLELVYRKFSRIPYGWEVAYRIEGSEINAI